MSILGLFAALLAAASVGLAVQAALLPRTRAVRQLDLLTGYGFAEFLAATEEEEDEAEQSESFIARTGAHVAARMSRQRVEKTRRDLLGAGMYDMSPERWIGISAMIMIAVPAMMIWFALSTASSAPLAILEIAFGGFAGYVVPQTILSRRARERLDAIHREMPGLVDLLVVAVESGMAFGGALTAASHRMRGPMADELELVIGEQTLGVTTSDALRNMADRCDVESVKQFARTLIHGERLGISVGSLLRTLASELRKKRRSEVEEQAQKAPIKILFPLVFLIFPSLFIVLMTPPLLLVMEGLG